MRSKQLFFTLFLLISFTAVKAQDRFFSQFYGHPLSLNPALTGTMNGTFRVNTAYRSQWSSVLQTPFTTFSASADTRLKANSNNFNHDEFGAGVVFTHDQFGFFNFNANAVGFSGAFHKDISAGFPQSISVGMYIGLEQRGTSYNNFLFQDQYRLGTGFTLESAENLPANQLAFMDLGLGINYTVSLSTVDQFFAGISVWHVNGPEISFFKDINNEDSPLEISAPLESRYTAHLGLNLLIAEHRSISPRIMVNVQGDHIAANLGSNFRFDFQDFNETKFHIGASVRVVKDFDATAIDALVLIAAVERERYKIGFSYDATLDDLQNEREGQGAFELTLSITGDYEEEALHCPEF